MALPIVVPSSKIIPEATTTLLIISTPIKIKFKNALDVVCANYMLGTIVKTRVAIFECFKEACRYFCRNRRACIDSRMQYFKEELTKLVLWGRGVLR